MTLLSRYAARDSARTADNTPATLSALLDDAFDTRTIPGERTKSRSVNAVMSTSDQCSAVHLSFEIATKACLCNSRLNGTTAWNHVRYSVERSDYMTESHAMSVLKEVSEKFPLRPVERLKRDRFIFNNVHDAILSNDMGRVFTAIKNLALYTRTMRTISCAAKGTLLFTQTLGRATDQDRTEYNESTHTPILTNWVSCHEEFSLLWKAALQTNLMTDNELWFLNHMSSYYCEMLSMEAL